jgi:hypothetical protein
MNTTIRQTPRFIPTLTEVVNPATVTRGASKSDLAPLVDAVLQQIQPLIDKRIEDESVRFLQSLVATHSHELSIKIQEEMTLFVRQAVTDALATKTDLD